MKYKINNNDKISSIFDKDLVDSNKQKKIKSQFNAKYKINIKKNKKKRIFLFSLYLLAFGATTVTTILLLHTTTTINNSQFNPNANNELWKEYYQNHHHDAAPISLDATNNYFKNPNNIIIFDVIKKEKDNIDFSNVLNSIDQNLQKLKIENDIDNDNPDPNLLPFNFFSNVKYNSAVKFTIGNDKIAITNNSFTLPKNFNDINKYLLNMTTNNQAPFFGIKNINLNLNINLNIINKVAVDLGTLSLDFPKKIISINDPQHATIKEIKDKWLVPEIENQFETVLSKALNVDKEKIHGQNYYEIDFEDISSVKDFTNFVTVKFTITSLNNNPWNFTGTNKSTIIVKNDKADLENMKELTSEIEKQYNNDDNNFQITLDNQKDQDGNYINADSKLSAENVNFVNDQIIKSISQICQNYFQKNYQDLSIDTSDYTITTNLKVGDDIFNDKLGKNIEITISAINTSYKLNGNLKAKAIIHGHNKNNITNSYSDKFALKGIWLKDEKDPNILQEGQHFYQQDKLLKNWITDKGSLLNIINKNSYQPVANSFSGIFTMNCQLEKEQQNRSMTVDISKDITGGKATNFWDLITKTKSIFLETDVSTTSGWSVNNVKLIFTDGQIQPDENNTLYTLDLSSKFAGITVSARASLTFDDFNFKFNYQVIS